MSESCSHDSSEPNVEKSSDSEISNCSEGWNNEQPNKPVHPVFDLLFQYLFAIKDFSNPNLAKTFADSEELSVEHTEILRKNENLDLHYRLFSDRFMAVVQERDDIRSYRVAFCQSVGNVYDYSLIVLDVYFHNFFHPAIVLRSGLGKSRLSLLFDEKGLFLPNIYSLCSTDPGRHMPTFFQDLHRILFIENKQLEIIKKDENESGELNALLSFSLIKYVILENLTNPITEFTDFISTYYILFRLKLKSFLNSLVVDFNFSEKSLCSEIDPLNFETLKNNYAASMKILISEALGALNLVPCASVRFNQEIPCEFVLKGGSQNDPQPPESKSLYFQTLKDLRFNTYDFCSKKSHELLKSLKQSGVPNTKRMSQEVKVLSQHLPCEPTGAIFVVMDQVKMELLKALISGTEDTPYAHGLYEFHIACPAEYPQKPPLVSIITTGHGEVRFNPNLYDDGFVCLSVINTWDGDPSERWNPTHSNILQVLLSIQVLVMDNQVIQKEPEFEYLQENSPENVLYTSIVKYNNVKHAMLGMLKNPPPEFAEVIEKHFALKRNAIMATVDKWLEEAKEFVNPKDGEIDYLVMDHNSHTCGLFKKSGYYSLLLEARNELLLALDRLPSLGIEKENFELIQLSEDQVQMTEFRQTMQSFVYLDKEFAEAGGFRHRLGRLIQPLSSYEENLQKLDLIEELRKLQVNEDSLMFVVRDTERYDLLKVIIAGPKGTDYECGLFLFDVALLQGFPNVAPVVELVTTGKNSVNFHKKLRKNGDVLGLTWSPENSLIDFFYQLQSLFKDSSEEKSDNYRTVIQYNTFEFAIRSMYANPPIEFEDAVIEYFEKKKNQILSVWQKWSANSEKFTETKDNCDENSETLKCFSKSSPSQCFMEAHEKFMTIQQWSSSQGSDASDQPAKKHIKNKKKTAKNLKKNLDSDEENDDFESDYNSEESDENRIMKKNS